VLAALAFPPAAVLVVFYAWPLGTLLSTVVDGTAIDDALHVPGLPGVVWFTLWQALLSTACTLVAGLAPAYVLARYRFPGRRALRALVTVPFLLPTVVVGAAFSALLPERWHGTAAAIIAAHVFFNVAVVVRLCGGLLSALPHDLIGAAGTLGATPAQVARHVVLPLLRPALIASALVVFLFCSTSLGVVRILGGPGTATLEVVIARRATVLGDVATAAVLTVLQLLALGAVVVIGTRLQRRSAVALTGRGGARPARRSVERAVVAVVAVGSAIGFATPLTALVRRSFQLGDTWTLSAWRQVFAGSPEVRPGVTLGVDALGAVRTSLEFAVVATALSVAVGALAAWAITRAGRAGRALDAGAMLPLGTSAVTIGLGMLITFDVPPVDWRAEWWLIPVGHALVAIPFVVRALVPVLRAIPASRRDAAAVLGASPWQVFLAIDARPLGRPLLAAAAFAAAISLGEFGATTFLTRAGDRTMPIAIADLLGRAGATPRAQGFALATLLMVLTAVVVLVGGAGARDDDRR
jgi:thiamine transport system permease protein